MESQKSFEGGDVQRLHLRRYGRVRLAHFEVAAPKGIRLFVMSEDFHGVGAEHVGIEQFTAVIIIDIGPDLIVQMFKRFFEALARAADKQIINILRGGENDEADKGVEDYGGDQHLWSHGAAARQDGFEDLDDGDGAKDVLPELTFLATLPDAGGFNPE